MALWQVCAMKEAMQGDSVIEVVFVTTISGKAVRKRVWCGVTSS